MSPVLKPGFQPDRASENQLGVWGPCKPPSRVQAEPQKFLKQMIFNTTEGQFLERQASN